MCVCVRVCACVRVCVFEIEMHDACVSLTSDFGCKSILFSNWLKIIRVGSVTGD